MKIKTTLFYFGRQPSEMSGKYEATLTNLSKAAVKALKKEGVNVRHEPDDEKREDWGYFVVARSQFPPKVVDAHKVAVPDDVLIGNGTVANVVVQPFQWTFKNKKGVSLGFTVVQILDLVPYDPNTGLEELEEEEGFSVESDDEEDEGDDEEFDELDDEVPF